MSTTTPEPIRDALQEALIQERRRKETRTAATPAPVITVNGVPITESDIAAEMQYHPAASRGAAREAAAQALVLRELLLQEAARLGLAPANAEEGEDTSERLIRSLLEREIRTPAADAATCRRYYENNRRRFRSPDIFEAAHIFFPVGPHDVNARASARRKAKVVLEELAANPARFDKLARELSACPSAEQGGQLGQLSRGDTAPEFETFLFNLDEGQICPVPVETRYGVHVVRLDRKLEGRELPFDSVRKRIADYLEACSRRRAIRQYLQILIGRAEITGIDLAGADSPLVQ